MKTLRIVLVVSAALFTAGYVFVQWANSPENVRRLQEDRAMREKRKHAEIVARAEQEKKDAEEARYWAGKTDADVQWIADQRFDKQQIDAPLEPFEMSGVKWEKDALLLEKPIITPKQQAEHVFAVTKDEYANFVVEMEYELQGCRVGISFNRHENGANQWLADKLSTGYEEAEVTINGTIARAHSRRLGWVQAVRFEKKGKQVTISVGKEIILQQTFKKFSAEKGKIGFFLRYANVSQFNRSARASIKRFKLGIYR